MTFEQPELPFDAPEQEYDHYTIQLRRGPAHGENEVVREHTAKSVEDAESMIEALRDTSLHRSDVTWQDEEVNADGMLYGLAPGGVVYVIQVTPSLSVPLS